MAACEETRGIAILDKQQLDDIPRKYQFITMRRRVVAERLKKLEEAPSGHVTDTRNGQPPSNTDELTRISVQRNKFKAILEACDTEAQLLVTTYAKSTCQSICKQMQERLPRELRDMIYDFILPKSSSPFYRNWVWAGKGSSRCIGCGYERKSRVSCRKHGSPHLRSAEFLGIQTHAELAETWYSTSVFEFSHESTLENLLHDNPWNLPFEPTELIKEVHINLSKYEFMEYEKGAEGVQDSRVTTKMENLLSPLFGLKLGTKITIRIIVFTNEWVKALKDPQPLVEMLQPTFTTYKKLHDQGYQVEILQRYGEHSERDWRTVYTAEAWVQVNKGMFRPQ